MKTRKIGEIFALDRDFLQVVKGVECGKCALRIFGMCTLNSHRNILSGACLDDFRADNENVHFEKIGEVDTIYRRWANYNGLIHRKVNANSWIFNEYQPFTYDYDIDKKKAYTKNSVKYRRSLFDQHFY